MGKKGRDDRISIYQSFFAGGIAGVASRTITSPLDVVKILAQVGTKDTSQGFVRSFRNIYTKEGIRGFWKGNGIACVRLFPYNAVQFAVFTKLKVILSDPYTGKITMWNSLLAGSVAGIAATVATYPTDMVKTRLTVAHADPLQSKYKGMVHAFTCIYKEEGARAFFKGMNASIIGVIPFAGGTFMAYEILDKAFGTPRDKMSPIQNFINGCLAASFAQTFSFPFDTIRKKLQAQSRTVTEDMKPDVEFNGMIDAFVQTVKKNGVLGLWRGNVANLAKVAPYAGIMFATFEMCKRIFIWNNGYTQSPWKDIPIPGVDQTMNPSQLKRWYEQQKQKEK